MKKYLKSDGVFYEVLSTDRDVLYHHRQFDASDITKCCFCLCFMVLIDGGVLMLMERECLCLWNRSEMKAGYAKSTKYHNNTLATLAPDNV